MKKFFLAALVLLGLVGGLLVALPYLAPDHVLEFAVNLERSGAGLLEDTASVPGHDIRYLHGGRADGPVLLLLHGFGADKDNWTRFAAHLAEDYRLVIPDLPGFGFSSRVSDASYDILSQVVRVSMFMDRLGLDQVHVAGNSMGGHLAAAMAIERPERVASVALFANAGITTATPSELDRLREGGTNPLLVDTVEDFDRLLAFVFVDIPPIPGPIKQKLAERSVQFRSFNDKIFTELQEKTYFLDDRLGAVSAPTMILWGDTDRLLDVSAVAVMEPLLPNLKSTVVLENCGHLPMAERPAESAEHYRAFLAGVVASK